MNTIPNAKLCAALKVSRARVDQWLSRGFIKLENETTSGRVRQWTERDAIKLAALRNLADANLPLEQMAPHVQFLTRRSDDAYLVIHYGPQRLIAFSERGAPIQDDPAGPEVLIPGHLDSDIFPVAQLMRFLALGHARVAIVVPLHVVTAEIDRIFAEAVE